MTQSAIIDCPVISNGTVVDNLSVALDCKQPTASIGKWLDEVKPATEFRAFGATITMPKGGDFSARFNSLIEQLFAASFATKNNDELPKAEAVPFLTAIRESGKVDFPALNRFSVMQGLKVRQDNYRQRVRCEKNAVISTKINAAVIKETGTYKTLNKAFKEGGRPEVLKVLEGMKGVKAIGWNA